MDTIKIICDSVATCMNSVANGCQPMVKVAETSCVDVEIVNIICNTIQTIALYALVCFFIFKVSRCIISCFKQYIKRRQEKADREWKQNTDYITRLLDLQKDYAEIKYDEDGEVKKDKYDKDKYEVYYDYLNSIIIKNNRNISNEKK